MNQYFQSEQTVEVGHVANFGKYGNCEVISVNQGEAMGRNLITQEEFYSFCSDLDFVSSCPFLPETKEDGSLSFIQ